MDQLPKKTKKKPTSTRILYIGRILDFYSESEKVSGLNKVV